jgi:hypothetical protein
VNRRHAHTYATPGRTGGDDRPQGACVGRPEPFDDLIDGVRDPHLASTLEQARAICATCPIQLACLRENRAEEWVALILGVDPRDEPTTDERCGTTRGYDAHRKRKEKPCDGCKAAAARAKKARLQARRRAAA